MGMNKKTSPKQITGHSIFAVETTPDGIKVQTVFLTEDGKLLNLPAIFPDQTYALAQLDELRRTVIHHFKQAAQVGTKLIANANERGPGSDDMIQ